MRDMSDMLGKLTFDALPFYSDIAFGGALITVLGAAGVMAIVTWFGWWRSLWTGWLTSVDHKRIGIMYIVLAAIMLLRGFVDAIKMYLTMPRDARSLELSHLKPEVRAYLDIVNHRKSYNRDTAYFIITFYSL
jgi:hypothetical protein